MSRPGQGGKAIQAALLALLSTGLYWPVAVWFQSDDLVALAWAAEPAHVTADLLGPQYGLQRSALFWRPLVTASFAVEGALGGGDPFLPHLDNALAQGLDTLLLLLVLTEILGWSWACRATLLWALHPAHPGTVLWAVGRVDGHATFWVLLALLLHLRARGRRGRLLALGAFLMGLATKEQALCLPFLVAGLSLVRPIGAGLQERLAGSLRAAAPFGILGALYLGARLLLFGGRLGGYDAPPIQALDLPLDAALWLLRLLAPLTSPLGDRALGAWAAPLGLLALALALAGSLRAWRREPGRVGRGVLAGGTWLLAGLLPLLGVLQFTENLMLLRVFHLPLAGLLAAAGGGGWAPALILAAAFLPGHLPVRRDFAEAKAFNRRVHEGLCLAAAGPDQPLIVANLPLARGLAPVLQFGPDRLLAPPFGPGRPRVYPWRPLAPGPEQWAWNPEVLGPRAGRLLEAAGWEEAAAGGPPAGTIRPREWSERALPEFVLRPELPPVVDLAALLPLGRGEADLVLRTEPPAAGLYEVVILTGHGYTGCRVESGPDGSLSLRRILEAPSTREGGGSYVGFLLADAAEIDRDGLFLVGARRLDPATGAALARAREPAPVRWDRSVVRFFHPR